MEFIDYYKILEVPKTATEADIKKAYRKLARKYHPDVNPNDKTAEKKFKELNEANEVLSNAENRKKYDEYGKDWKHAEEFEKAKKSRQAYSGGESFGGEDFQGSFGGDFSEFFNSMYGGRATGRQAKFRGQDISAELQLDLKRAYTTHKQTLSVNGKNIRITIPAGVENGQTIKIASHGGPGANGGPNGDLYITFRIDQNEHFRRDGNNLYTTTNIDLYTAVLGGEAFINTLSGKVKLRITEGTQPGAKVKLKGKGFPVYKRENEFGDLYVTFNVTLPKSLSEKEKALFDELSKIRSHE
jgi:curved DNA-binding protein